MKNKAKMKKLSFIIILSTILTFLFLNSIKELKRGSLSAQSGITVSAHYYPWYRTWNFQLGQTVRAMPMIGAYDTSDPSVASQHLDQAAIGGIDVFSLEWTGPNPSDTGFTETEYDIDNGFLPAWWQKAYVMFYMFYDQAIRMNRKFGITNVQQAYNFYDSRVFNQFISDIDHIREKYFGHLGYFKMNYSPVIFWYLSRITSGPWGVALQTVRDHAGGNIFFVGNEVFNTYNFREWRIDKFDAISCYGVGLDPNYYSDGANVRDVADTAIPVYEYWQGRASDLAVWFLWPLEAEYDDDHIPGRPGNGEFYSYSKSDFSYFAQRIKKLHLIKRKPLCICNIIQ